MEYLLMVAGKALILIGGEDAGAACANIALAFEAKYHAAAVCIATVAI